MPPMFTKRLGIFLCLFFCTCFYQYSYGQQYEDALAIAYVSKYKDYAIAEMHRTGIPASVTLAQALHETDYGRSKLATIANNHFGAKCHNTWLGETIKHTDDAPNECFRKYANVYDSYVNHSQILDKSRYDFLFKLDQRDYKSWCLGLKKAGYATAPNYAYRLIDLIEHYALYVYDKMEYIPDNLLVSNTEPERIKYEYIVLTATEMDAPLPQPTPEWNIQQAIIVPEDIAKQPISVLNKANMVAYSHPVYPQQIASLYQVSLSKVVRYNNLSSENEIIPAHTNIFLSKKREKAVRKQKYHFVKENETLKEIAAQYAIDLDKLYKNNWIRYGEEVKKGEVVFLRGKAPFPPKVYMPNKKPTAPTEMQYQEMENLVDISTQEANFRLINQLEPEQSHEKRTYGSSFILDKNNVNTLNTETKPIEKTPVLTSVSVPKSETPNIATTEITSPKAFATYETTETASSATTQVLENLSLSANTNAQHNIAENETPQFHQVTYGENLYRISLKYNTSVENLRQLNSLKGNDIYAGSTIRVR
ncbi:MAG: glucosaminidase domain-containing protein [Chitinophagales bacterium]|nr:glucosaminidase domain-containing protein [Bacteroidota bacterium]MCB9042386.1 glucosaminidase domain-containing protein [Chitinophagales bacterium]